MQVVGGGRLLADSREGSGEVLMSSDRSLTARREGERWGAYEQ